MWSNVVSDTVDAIQVADLYGYFQIPMDTDWNIEYWTCEIVM